MLLPRAGRRTALLTAFVLPLLTLSACGSDTAHDGVQVAAAFYPLAWTAAQVLGDDGTVTNLTSPGAEPHDLELGLTQTALVDDADLVVLEHGFQPAVDDAAAASPDTVLDVADVIALQPFADHDHTETHARSHDHHHGDELDPHFWHDPLLVADLGDAIAERLATIDAAHADDYRERARGLRASMTTLDREFTDGLADCARDDVVVSHDAFGYLTRYGLHLVPIAGLSPDAEPGPAQLAALSRLVRDEGLTTVFSETLASPRLADTLAREAGVRSAVLDPIEGLSDQTSEEDYPSLMRANLSALVEANGC